MRTPVPDPNNPARTHPHVKRLILLLLSATTITAAAEPAPYGRLLREQAWNEVLATTATLPPACDSDELALARRARAEAALHLGQWARASESLAPCTTRLASDAGLLGTALKVSRLGGDTARMQDYGRRYSQLRPGEAAGYLAMARAWQQQKQPARALEAINDGLARVDSHLLHAEKAALLLAAGDAAAAARAADQALKQQAGEPDYLVLRGRSALLQNDAARAWAAFDQALRSVALAPADWHLWRAEAAAQLGQWEAVSQDAYAALLLSPSRASYLLICQSALALQDWAALAQYAENAHANGFADARLRRYLVQAQEGLGQFDVARRGWQALLQENPEDRQARLQVARLAVTARDWQLTVDTLAPLTDQYSDGEAMALAAYARLRQGDLVAASDSAQNALALAPREAMAMLVLADVALQGGRLDEASARCDGAKRLLPGQPLVLATCARVHAGQQLPELARAELAVAEQLAPDDPEVMRARRSLEPAGASRSGGTP